MIFSARKLLSERMNLPRWLVNRWQDQYLIELLNCKAQDDEVVMRKINKILLIMRFKVAIKPYLAIFKLGWEFINGKYWKSAKKIHSGSDQTSGSSPGAVSQPIPQFTGYGGGFSGPAFSGASSVSASVETFDDAGIRAGEVTAYRCWKLAEDGFLHSVVYDDFVWKPNETAEGNPVIQGAGIYAYKSVLLLHNYGSVEKGTVTGTVDLWGDVYEHEHGYRAQYAQVSSIDESPYYDAPALRKLYGLNKRRKKKKPAVDNRNNP